MTEVEKWRRFWSLQKNALERSDSEEFRTFCGREIMLMLGDRSHASVLEIGCSDGALFPYYGFDTARYTGVDFSSHLLEIFKQRHPDVTTLCADGSTFVQTGSKYDVIFSHQVVQCFDRQMLEDHIARASSMMHSQSVLLCASIPWKACRGIYRSGAAFWTLGPSFARRLKGAVSVLLRGDSIGHWYEPRDFVTIGAKHGLSAGFYGCMLYPYRFHALLRKVDDERVEPTPGLYFRNER